MQTFAKHNYYEESFRKFLVPHCYPDHPQNLFSSSSYHIQHFLKLHQNLSISFWVVLLANKPTNKQTNPPETITFLVKVIDNFIIIAISTRNTLQINFSRPRKFGSKWRISEGLLKTKKKSQNIIFATDGWFQKVCSSFSKRKTNKKASKSNAITFTALFKHNAFDTKFKFKYILVCLFKKFYFASESWVTLTHEIKVLHELLASIWRVLLRREVVTHILHACDSPTWGNLTGSTIHEKRSTYRC